MPLKKLVFKSGVNRENTRYTTEGGYYECDKIRFRQGTPEKIGGWERISSNTFLGVCRSIWNWITLSDINPDISSLNLLAIGTNLKYYIEKGGAYYDITPLEVQSTSTVTETDPFDVSNNSNVVVVNVLGSNMQTGDGVVISNVLSDVNGIPYYEFNTYHPITRIDADSFSFETVTSATSNGTGVGGVDISITLVSNTVTLSTPFDTVNLSSTVTVTHTNNGHNVNDFVTFFNATTVAGLDLNNTYQITRIIDADTYEIDAGSPANATVTGGGGPTVYAQYEIPTGPEYENPLTGWGAGPWGFGVWGVGTSPSDPIRLWSQSNFGQDLVFGPRNGPMYYWAADFGTGQRGFPVTLMPGANEVPETQNFIFISDVYRFVFAFGANDYFTTVKDPMLVRWSDQESVTDWAPSATNQAGSLRLSHGSQIITAIQTRQEIFVLTDSAAYSLQYLGPPYVWTATLLADNISIMGQNAIAIASGVVFWMGVDKFYKYDGRVQTMRCDLRQYIFNDINMSQTLQFFAGTNEGFNEVWFFYCSANSTELDKYVVYNYLEDIWYYGTMRRTAWLDSGIRQYPIAATYSHNIVNHEAGLDDGETAVTQPIHSYITTSQFDIDDGHNFGFIWRIIPDITFRGSTTEHPQVTMTLMPYQNSGSGVNDPASQGGTDNATVVRTTTVPIEEFTGQVYIRVRGRQLAFMVENEQLGSTWQLGSPRIDIKPDGRR